MSNLAQETLVRANALAHEAIRLESAGQWERSLSLRQESLRTLEQVFGLGHSHTDQTRLVLANTLVHLGRCSDARKLLHQSVAIRAKEFGENSPPVADALHRIAQTFRLDGQPSESLPYYRQAQLILDQSTGNASALAIVLNNQALALLDMGDVGGAEQQLLHCLRVLRGSGSLDRSLCAAPLTLLGEIHRSLGQLACAFSEQQQALALLPSEPPDTLLRLTISSHLAAVLSDLRHIRQALEIYRKTIPLLTHALGADHTDVLKLRRGYANTLALEGNHTAARTVLEDVLATVRTKAPTNHLLHVALLTDLASRQQDLGDLDAARHNSQAALAVALSQIGPDHALTCRTREQLGLLYLTTGSLAEADELLEQALAAHRRNAEKDPRRQRELASGLLERAKFERVLGRTDEADTLLREAIAIQSKCLGKCHPDLAESLEQCALLADEKGALKDALRLHEEALRIRLEILGPKNPMVAQTRMNLADLYARLKHISQANLEAQAAHSALESNLGPDHLLTTMAAFNHAGILFRLGQLGQAASLYQFALDGLERQHSRHVSTAARDYALLEVERGRLDEAARLARCALVAQESLWRDILRFGSEQDRLAWTGFRNLLTALVAVVPKDSSPLCTAVLRLKGAVLDSLIEDRQMAEASCDPATRSSVAALRKARQARYRLELDAISNQPPPTAELAAARHQVESLESKLAQRFSALAESRRGFSVTTGSIQAKLSPEDVLVEYIRYRHWLGRGRTESRYGALVFQHTTPTRWVQLGPATGKEGIDDLANELVAAMFANIPPPSAALLDCLQRLREQVWDSVQDLLPLHTRRVFIAPDAELNFVPFAGLWLQDHFLGEKLSFRYLTCARDLLVADYQPPTQRSVDIWADPQFARPGWRRVADSLTNSLRAKWAGGALRRGTMEYLPKSYDPLPHARLEGKALASKARANGCRPVSLFIGPKARKGFLRNRPAPYILHLATHGSFLPDPGSSMSADFLREPRVALLSNPLARSWLALAGANETLAAWRSRHAPDPNDDGLLTAEEVSTLNLDHTWLVTLSACCSGLGTIRCGEGVFGLRRSFAFAGARHLLLTLWPISDERSRELMEAFYQEAFRTNDVAEALARVQRAKLSHWRQSADPAMALLWAGPFVLSSRGL